jgi:CheY-like chemotaxis protein
MPKMNGLEFLRTIKTDENLKKIPVIVLTTSSQEEDVVESFNFGVAGYIVKSVDYIEFTQAIKTINSYWTLSKVPPNGD